jgi:hypothetical protein
MPRGLPSVVQSMLHVFEKPGYDFIIVLTIFIMAFSSYYAALFRHPVMYGIDGAYYLIQVESILSTGMMKYPDPPFSFHLFQR